MAAVIASRPTNICFSARPGQTVITSIADTVDISPLAPRRFSESRSIKGNYDNIWTAILNLA
jgi:hypothetical protein